MRPPHQHSRGCLSGAAPSPLKQPPSLWDRRAALPQAARSICTGDLRGDINLLSHVVVSHRPCLLPYLALTHSTYLSGHSVGTPFVVTLH